MSQELVVSVLGVVATVVAVVYFLTGHAPEQAATHERAEQSADETRSAQLYSLVDRPAGPDAEEQTSEPLRGRRQPV